MKQPRNTHVQAGMYSLRNETEAPNAVEWALQDVDGNVIERWKPGKPVQLNMKTILMAGGISLERLETTLGQNFLEGAGAS